MAVDAVTSRDGQPAEPDGKPVPPQPAEPQPANSQSKASASPGPSLDGEPIARRQGAGCPSRCQTILERPPVQRRAACRKGSYSEPAIVSFTR